MTSSLDPRFEAYLRANRAFMAPAVEQAIASLELGSATRLLDAGTGGGGALPGLVRAAAPGAVVAAVDLHDGVIALAAEHARATGVRDQVELRATDVAAVLAEAAEDGGTYDAIWAGEVVWPGNFDDPAGLVRQMAAAVAPGGVVALFYTNYYQSMFLPGHSRLERTLRTASELRWGLPGDGPTHYERHVSWLVEAGLHNVSIQVFPRVGLPADDADVRPYLETAVLPELLQSATSCGRDAGMSPTDIAQAEELLSPDSPHYVLDQPGYYVVHPTILALGRR